MSVGIDELARTLGQLRWAELRWFETLGAWMRTAPESEARICLAVSCQRRAAHAGLLAERLPAYLDLSGCASIDGDDVTPEGVTIAGADAGDLLHAAAGDRTVERLRAFYGLGLVRLVAEYGILLAATDARTDGPTHRTLSMLLADDAAELAEGDALVRRLDGPGDGGVSGG